MILARKKDDPYYTSVDFALMILKHYPDLRGWLSVRVGFEFIQTFLTFVSKWVDADDVFGECMGDVVSSIEDAFAMAGLEIESALLKKGHLAALRSKLEEKIEVFQPRMREAYDFLSVYVFQITSPPITGFDDWDRLCDLINRDLREVLFSTCAFSDQFWRTLCDLRYCLREIQIPKQPGSGNDEIVVICLTRLQGVIFCLARLVFVWWVDKTTDVHDMTIMLSNLLQKINATSPQILDMYWKVITTADIHLDSIYHLADIFFRLSQGSLGAVHRVLLYLIECLVDPSWWDESQTEHEKLLIKSDIRKLVFEAASITNNETYSSELVLFLRVELLKMEIVLTQLRTNRSTFMEDAFESIHEGLSSLQTQLLLKSEKFLLIIKRIEQVAADAEYLNLILPEYKYNEVRQCDAHQIIKLFLEFKLLKIQTFLLMVVHVVRGEIHSLINDGLELLCKYFSAHPLNKPGDKERFFTWIERVAKKLETPLYSFFQSNQLSEHKISLFLSNFLGIVNLMKAEIEDNYLFLDRKMSLPKTIISLPKTHQGLGFVDLFLEKLSGLLKYKADSIGYSVRPQIEDVLNGLDSLRYLLEEFGENRNENPQLKHLRRRVTKIAYEADYILDWRPLEKSDWYLSLMFSNVFNEMKAIRSELAEIVPGKNDFAKVQDGVQTAASEHEMITKASAPEVGGEVVVSLNDQEEIIINRLTRGSSQRRKVLTIYGMPGIGKTTLAKKLYDNPRVNKYFRKLAWCCVSQVYRRRELLLKILSDIVETTNEIWDRSDEDLMEMMYKGLKGKRYLVVMDDVWDTQAWEELASAFPDDSNGSRILFTSRFEKVALNAQNDSVPHPLRFLTEDESWNLLQERVFLGEDTCPQDLKEVVRTIAKCCKGLPLSVVAVAGILKRTERKEERWKEIKEDLESRILEDPENQCMHILELSYNHLPDDLKPCFLYFAAFGEDNEVPVQKVIKLWIAEGFVRKVNQDASLEDMAESYVMDLIGRSLLMVARRGSNGRVKVCKVHDMLYNLCLRKVEEDNFLQYVNGYEKLFPFSNNRLDYGLDLDYPPISVSYDQQHRLSIFSKRMHFVMLKPSGPSVRTLLFSATSDTYPKCPYDDVLLFITDNFKLLNVLDIDSVNIGSSFPEGIELLDSLRYLAISGNIKFVPSTIAKLWNLQTLMVKGLMGKVALPDTIWSMSSLRHLHVSNQAIFNLQGSSDQMHNMVTLSWPVLSHGDDSEEMMKLFPKLRKLSCTLSDPAQYSERSIRFPALDFLMELESLKVIYYGHLRHYCQFKGISFPLNLKKLSLSHFSLTWDEFSAIGEIPNLKVLKLVSIAFDNLTWDMKDDEFKQLEYLKLDSLKIVDWNASSDHLPNLQQLVLRNCTRLQEVPSDFGQITTLQMIEVKLCSGSAANSVWEIQEQQLEYGNNGFKAFVNVSPADFRSSV